MAGCNDIYVYVIYIVCVYICVCVRVRVRACARARVRMCVRAHVYVWIYIGGGREEANAVGRVEKKRVIGERLKEKNREARGMIERLEWPKDRT